jgi:hypothetical protein
VNAAGVVGEVVPLDVDAEAAQVVEVGGEGDQRLVDVGPADAGVAAQRGFEDPNGGGWVGWSWHVLR